METPEHVVIPSKWIDTLCDRLTIESLPPIKPFSLYIESLNNLREALTFFALASSVNSSAWEDLVDLPVCFHKDQAKVRYRFHVESQLADVTSLLDQRHGYSTSFMQAIESIRGPLSNASAIAEALRVHISLVVKPRQWTPTLLNELAAMCKAHNPSNLSSGCIAFDIVDVQLDLQEIQLSEVAVFALLMFLRCELPLSTLCVAVDAAGWNQRDVTTLVQAIDRPGMVSLKIILSSGVHYGTLLSALEEQNISSLSTLTPQDDINILCPISTVSNYQIFPAPLRAIHSLRLSIEQEVWVSQLHVVSNHLFALHLYGDRTASPNKIQLNAVLKSCPQLRMLELVGVTVDSLDTLIDGYASGSCIIRSLSLQRVEVGQADSVSRLPLLLKDMSSRVAQTLFEFAWVPSVGDVPTGIMDLFVDVVNNNPRLRHLELKNSPTTTAAKNLMRHHFEPLLAYDNAFVGLVHDAGLGVPAAAIKRLSDDVVVLIFSFAGIRAWRSVRIHDSTQY